VPLCVALEVAAPLAVSDPDDVPVALRVALRVPDPVALRLCVAEALDTCVKLLELVTLSVSCGLLDRVWLAVCVVEGDAALLALCDSLLVRVCVTEDVNVTDPDGSWLPVVVILGVCVRLGECDDVDERVSVGLEEALAVAETLGEPVTEGVLELVDDDVREAVAAWDTLRD